MAGNTLKQAFETVPQGQILYVINDGGYKAGCGAKFGRVTPCGHMAEVVIFGQVEWITLARLQGGKIGK